LGCGRGAFGRRGKGGRKGSLHACCFTYFSTYFITYFFACFFGNGIDAFLRLFRHGDRFALQHLAADGADNLFFAACGFGRLDDSVSIARGVVGDVFFDSSAKCAESVIGTAFKRVLADQLKAVFKAHLGERITAVKRIGSDRLHGIGKINFRTARTRATKGMVIKMQKEPICDERLS